MSLSSKSKFTVRAAQLLRPYGVGSLVEIDGQSFFVEAIQKWPTAVEADNRQHTRKKNLIDIDFPLFTERLRKGLKRPKYQVAVRRFPQWHFCPNCNTMRMIQYHDQENISDDAGGQANISREIKAPRCPERGCNKRQLAPMRFIAVCKNGHINDINWYYLAHRPEMVKKTKVFNCTGKSGDLQFVTTKGAGGDFTNMHITCKKCNSKPCPENNLEILRDPRGIQNCNNRHPGVSRDGDTCEDDGKRVRMEAQPRGAQAIHSPSTLSALDISMDVGLKNEQDQIKKHKRYERLKKYVLRDLAEQSVHEPLDFYKDEFEEIGDDCGVSIESILSLITGDDNEADEFEGVENIEITQSEILSNEFPVLTNKEGVKTRNLYSTPQILNKVDKLFYYFSKIVQIERLREVRVFQGFQRINSGKESFMVPPNLNDPNSSTNWLPGQEVFGEGIFFEFNCDSLLNWERANEKALSSVTRDQIKKVEDRGLLLKKGIVASPRFIMLHTFAHLLINQLSFSCGYSSTSLRERVYSVGGNSGYAGVLVYTSDADSAGAMGGLVEIGQKEKIEEEILKALAKSTWCSSDPVCRELSSQGVDGLNAAACHACGLVAETSCEHNNILLNRLLVSSDGRINGRGKTEPVGFFNSLLAKEG